jgi:hypothetical protein
VDYLKAFSAALSGYAGLKSQGVAANTQREQIQAQAAANAAQAANQRLLILAGAATVIVVALAIR